MEKFKKIENEYLSAKTSAEAKEKLKILEEMIVENPEKYGEAFYQLGQKKLNDLRELNIKLALQEVSEIISLSYIAKNYFNKTKEWLYQRINGNIVNGKPAKFTSEEIDTLNDALQDMSKKIGSVRIA